MIRVKDEGDLYVHQDANWNVIGLILDSPHSRFAGRSLCDRVLRTPRRVKDGGLVERYAYTPYGELTVYQETGYGDRDGDGDVDATDKGTVGTTCTGTVSGTCRILDLDFDGDNANTDAGLFDSLPQGLSRHPGRPGSPSGDSSPPTAESGGAPASGHPAAGSPRGDSSPPPLKAMGHPLCSGPQAASGLSGPRTRPTTDVTGLAPGAPIRAVRRRVLRTCPRCAWECDPGADGVYPSPTPRCATGWGTR